MLDEAGQIQLEQRVGTNAKVLPSALEPLRREIESLSERIAEYNDHIDALAQGSYPQVALLKQIKGVGTLIALTFLLTLEDPHRFRKSRDVSHLSRSERADQPALTCI